MMSSRRFVILGLPSSGKTTFLAALWHIIGADEVDCGLTLERVVGDVSYLNAIAEAWRTFQPVPRTSQVGDTEVSMLVKRSADGESATLLFPDLAGEMFDIQVEQRQCQKAYVDGFENDGGILLFVSANTIEDGLSIVELNRRIPADEDDGSEGEGGDGTAPPSQEEGPVAEWSPACMPAQVRLVQMLVDLQDKPFRISKRRLAIVVSAWDLIPVPRPSPTEWLGRSMPLLAQFLNSAGDHFEYVVYGISAQGVDLEAGDSVKAAAKQMPSERIVVIGNGATQHDLAAPITWLMG